MMEKPETDEGKFAKTVPVEATIESPEIEMASKPLEVKDDKIVEPPENSRSEQKFGLKDERFVMDPYRVTMFMKGDFQRSNHVKSGRYYLPEIPLITPEGGRSGLLTSLQHVATSTPCAALYQRCFSEVPMIRLNSPNIDDFNPMKIVYWDNSFLLINGGKPVRVKIPTEVLFDWLDSRVGAEKDISNWSKKLDLEKYLVYHHGS